MTFLLKLWSSKYIILGVLLFVVGSIAAAYIKGRSDGVTSVTVKQVEQRIEDIGKGKKIEEKVRKLPESDLDRELERWMRD